MDADLLKKIVEAALLAAGRPLSIEQLEGLFEDHERPERSAIKHSLTTLMQECESRGYELKEVAGGYRFQVRESLSGWVSHLWAEKPPRYTRAFLETLALIAYRQPITRAEIEDIRGVSVSTTIIRGLLEREWVRVVGHKEVPGRPALYATTRQFLDYFNLQSLDELPPLSDFILPGETDTESALEHAVEQLLADAAPTPLPEESAEETLKSTPPAANAP
ncbi:SMC-Scp complex subunit ScpB [Thiorhodospira sibirica]|uniref:SMC-Scp complex subunit ScpB n=1 Tax=Thiorhodospira sibirica TaxID=154347 RepID=UPI00022C52B1|nr:SMC-Scp complex subunit ScpB [Thiorhodospira sibirica]